MKIKNPVALLFLIYMMALPVLAWTENTMMEPYQLGQNEILFSQSKRQVNAVNPTSFSNRAGSAFPGARGTNQLILYTTDYGTHTNTNEFGTEAVIEGNTVIELSGADSYIPPDSGAVLSGHGTAKDWINSNISVGTKIYYDPVSRVVTTYTTSQSYIFEAMQKIDEANSMINYYKETNRSYDFKVPMDYVKEAQNYVRKGAKNPGAIKKYSELAIEAANSAIKSVLPFRVNEFKGVWLRPTEKNESEIIASVQRIKSAGIDNIFLETYFHGKTIFPSTTMREYGFIAQNEEFTGFDPLAVWIREAHKNNIKVHIWFETFYVGNKAPYLNRKSILAVKPDWGNKTLYGYESANATPSPSEHNGYFLDPSNAKVQEFLLKLLSEIITCYRPDGINLDYIRYPQAISMSPSGNWGYTENARSLFYQRYGVDPVNLRTSDYYWSTWGNFRRQQVTDFLEKTGELCKKNGVYISAVIFPDKNLAYSRKMQDWTVWSQNHYVQGFTPLFLTCNSKTLNSQITTVLNYKAPETDLLAGLFVAFMDGSEEDLIRQIHETRKLNVNGVILFDYAHLDNKYVKALSNRVFSPNSSKKNDYKPENAGGVFRESSVETNRKQNEKFVIEKYDPNNVRTFKNKTTSSIRPFSKKK